MIEILKHGELMVSKAPEKVTSAFVTMRDTEQSGGPHGLIELLGTGGEVITQAMPLGGKITLYFYRFGL